MMVSYFIALAFGVARVIIGRDFLISHATISAGMSLFMAIGMIGAAYFHTEMRRSEVQIATDKAEEERSVQPNAQEEQMERISTFFEKEKPYLDPDLTLEQCADMMGTNRTYISLSLNSYHKKNFREYINGCRIEYAKKYILEHRDSKLEEVAEVSGFKSGAQFSRKFKEIEGVTPLVWIRNQI